MLPPIVLPPPRSFQQRLEACGQAFSRRAEVRATMVSALARMAEEAAGLTSASRASIWLHDRRARDLWLAARSGAEPWLTARVPADDPSEPAALGLTTDRPIRTSTPDDRTIVAPLRGWRRALGTLVLEDPSPRELTAGEVLELTHLVARHLSAAIENMQLLDEVVRQHRLLHDSFDSLVDLVIVTGTDARVVQMNDAARRALQAPSDPFGIPLASLVGDELAAWATSVPEPPSGEAAKEASAAAGRARTQTFTGSPLGGTLVVTVTTLISGDRMLIGHVMVARDVTEPRRLEAEREVLQARLVQSEKLAALGQFVAGVAHEINNPLQGVLGNVELLLRSTTDAAQKADLRRVLHEADRAAKIVRNLLVFSGVRRTVQRRLTVEGLISRVLTTRRASLAERRIEIVRRHPDRRARIMGDDLMLQQAFLNILMNAEHAIADAGTSGSIQISTGLSGDRRTVVTRIRDSGPGIDAAVLSRIFDPFFTTKDVNKGTGLGLTIAYGIVKDHGGMLHAANPPDGGAQFTIELPVADSDTPPLAAPSGIAEDA
ncbi:MAG: ATP-binding protein [Vicinamibacterales bacterium]